ncbi:MAG: hypothetical protein ABI693_34890, partial [Bryobacteraceae bacterium]
MPRTSPALETKGWVERPDPQPRSIANATGRSILAVEKARSMIRACKGGRDCAYPAASAAVANGF